jgi:hypothetical protein
MAGIRDILGSFLVIMARSILFSLIIPENIYKLILEIGNTTPEIDKILIPVL